MLEERQKENSRLKMQKKKTFPFNLRTLTYFYIYFLKK